MVRRASPFLQAGNRVKVVIETLTKIQPDSIFAFPLPTPYQHTSITAMHGESHTRDYPITGFSGALTSCEGGKALQEHGVFFLKRGEAFVRKAGLFLK